MRVTDESGEQIAEITPSVDGPVVTATLEEPLPAGENTIQWRVVSSDGHPIEGTLTVTVEQDAEEPAGETPAASDDGGEAATDDSAPDESSASEDTAAEEPAAEDEGGSLTPILVVLGVVVVGAVVAVLVIVRRRD